MRCGVELNPRERRRRHFRHFLSGLCLSSKVFTRFGKKGASLCLGDSRESGFSDLSAPAAFASIVVRANLCPNETKKQLKH